jgi:hypothetical protein
MYINIIVLIIYTIFIYNYLNIKLENKLFDEDYNGLTKKISVIILNYNRPHNLDKSIPELLKIKQIDEIIISNGKKATKKSFDNPKVISIDDWNNNEKYYTLLRFKNYTYCKNNRILILDDDIIPTQELITDMLIAYKKDSNNIYGAVPRLCNKDGYYTMHNNKYNYILTRIILCSKDVLKNVWENMENNTELFNIVVSQKGNCEDLFFNYEFMKLYNKKPKYICSEYNDLDMSNGFSNTDGVNHIELRTNFCKLIYN